MLRARWNKGAIGLSLLTLGGCNLKEFTVNTTAPVLSDAANAFAQESDVTLAHDAAPAQLKTMEGFLAASPKNPILLRLCAQGYIEYAFGFLEDELEAMPDDAQHQEARAHTVARATLFYDRGLGYALKWLALSDAAWATIDDKDPNHLEALAAQANAKQAPGLFFAGLALASSINLNRNDLSRVVALPKAKVLLQRAHALDPKFYNGGPAMLLGVLAAAQGRAMGGEPEKAKQFFDEAITLNGGKYLLTKVLMARYLGVVLQDRALFESTLKAVLATPASIGPDVRLANELAQRRAARYLAHVEDFF